MRRPKELSLFGKELRKLRLDFNVSAKEMSAELGYGACAVSNMERGFRNIPPTIVEDLDRIYGLTPEQAERLEYARKFSNNKIEVKIPAKSPLHQKAIEAFAANVNMMTEDGLKTIIRICNSKRNKTE